MTVSKLIAKKEVQKAITQSRALLRCALPEGTFGEREEAALAVSNEIVRSLLEEELQELADGYGSELLVDGAPYKEHEPGTVVYHSLCGGLEVTRSSYRQMGVHNGPTVVPLERKDSPWPVVTERVAGDEIRPRWMHSRSLGTRLRS